MGYTTSIRTPSVTRTVTPTPSPSTIAVQCYNCGPSYESVNIVYVNCSGQTIERGFAPGQTDTLCVDEMIDNPGGFCTPTGVSCFDCVPCPEYNPQELPCQCVNVTITQQDLNNANGNTQDGTINGHIVNSPDGKVVLTVYECSDGTYPSDIRVFDTAGTFNICIYSIEYFLGASLFIFQNDTPQIATSSYQVTGNPCTLDGDCI